MTEWGSDREHPGAANLVSQLNLKQKRPRPERNSYDKRTSTQSSYMYSIKAINYRGNTKEDSSCVTFSEGDELHTMILNYYRNQLSALQQKFERL